MSFRTAVLECVLGHKNDKKYAIEESKEFKGKRCFHLESFETNGVT